MQLCTKKSGKRLDQVSEEDGSIFFSFLFVFTICYFFIRHFELGINYFININTFAKFSDENFFEMRQVKKQTAVLNLPYNTIINRTFLCLKSNVFFQTDVVESVSFIFIRNRITKSFILTTK